MADLTFFRKKESCFAVNLKTRFVDQFISNFEYGGLAPHLV